MFRRLIAWWRKPSPLDDDGMRSLSVKTPDHILESDQISSHQVRPKRNLLSELREGMDALRDVREQASRDADFWDIAEQDAEPEPEPEPGRVEYRFLDIPYDTGD